MATKRSSVFDNVNPRLAKLIETFKYGPYGVRSTSGFRSGDPRQHGKGNALDVELYDPKTGAALNNYQDPTTFSAYQQYANELYRYAMQSDPELAKALRWGGYFSGDKNQYGALDLMHFDAAGNDIGMAGGSWEGGLTPEQAKLWGLSPGGGVGGAGGNQQGPSANTQVVNYTPEQRRNAIASIESAGSGDYNAKGIWIGDPESRDRAYGRYQIMGKNIPAWSKEVLGRVVTPEEFMADPKLQDAIFDAKFGDYVRKYGESGAAQAWLGGEGSIGKTDRQDPLGTSVGSYAQKYLAALGAPGGVPSTPGAPTYGAGGSLAPLADPSQSTQPKSKMQSFMESLAGGLGSMSGGAGAIPTPKIAPQRPMGQTTQIMAPLADTSARDQLAQQMQQRIAALNSGKLYG
jgi:hypothetical protein